MRVVVKPTNIVLIAWAAVLACPVIATVVLSTVEVQAKRVPRGAALIDGVSPPAMYDAELPDCSEHPALPKSVLNRLVARERQRSKSFHKVKPLLEEAYEASLIRHDFDKADALTLRAITMLEADGAPAADRGEAVARWCGDSALMWRQRLLTSPMYRKAFADYPHVLSGQFDWTRSLPSDVTSDEICRVHAAAIQGLTAANAPAREIFQATERLAWHQLEECKDYSGAVNTLRKLYKCPELSLDAHVASVRCLLALDNVQEAAKIGDETIELALHSPGTQPSDAPYCRDFANVFYGSGRDSVPDAVATLFAEYHQHAIACRYFRQAADQMKTRQKTEFDIETLEHWYRSAQLANLAQDAAEAQHVAEDIRALLVRQKTGQNLSVDEEVRLHGPPPSPNQHRELRDFYYLKIGLRHNQKRFAEMLQFIDLATELVDADFRHYPTEKNATSLLGHLEYSAKILLEVQDKQAAERYLNRIVEFARTPRVLLGTAVDAHDAKVSLAKLHGASSEEFVNAIFPQIRSEMVLNWKNDIAQNRARRNFCKSVRSESQMLIEDKRTDLAIKNYRTAIAELKSRLPGYSANVSELHSYFYEMLEEHMQRDLLAEAKPDCPRCKTKLQISRDYPKGCIISRHYYWRCGQCALSF